MKWLLRVYGGSAELARQIAGNNNLIIARWNILCEGNVAGEADETARQHHMLQPGDRFGDGLGLRHVHQPDARSGERALHGTARIQLRIESR